MMLHAKYLNSNPYSFWQEDFQSFSYINLYKTCDSWGGDNNDTKDKLIATLVVGHQMMLHVKYLSYMYISNRWQKWFITYQLAIYYTPMCPLNKFQAF